jgi:hypothetical protein
VLVSSVPFTAWQADPLVLLMTVAGMQAGGRALNQHVLPLVR